jgi:hypothetical protein
MDRRRAGRNHRSVPARAATISTKTQLFMAIALTRCSSKANSRDGIQNLWRYCAPDSGLLAGS